MLERFGALSAAGAARLAKVAELAAKFLKKGAESFVTNFVADSGSTMLNQAVHGQPVTVGDDLASGAWAAGGTAVFTGGGAALVDTAGWPGGRGDRGGRQYPGGRRPARHHRHGAGGNVAGGLTADIAHNQDVSTMGQDALTNAATGAFGNAQNHGVNHALEQHGSLSGKNLSDRGELADSAFKNTVGTTLNTGVYAAGSGIEADV